MTKTKRIDIRLTPEEKEVLVKRAHKKNFNLTEYILYCILKDISGDIMMKVSNYKETEGRIIYLNKKETLDLIVALDKLKSDDPVLKELMIKLWNR